MAAVSHDWAEPERFSPYALAKRPSPAMLPPNEEAMIAGRRDVRVADASRWVFNKLAQAYAARPRYPDGLVAALAEFAPADGRIGDIGAGIGHLALPLAERGFEVLAVEPAEAMLIQLRQTADDRGIRLCAMHAAAEALPIGTACLDLVIVADSLHFINIERAAPEIARVLRPGGALAIVTSKFSETPFMQALTRVMEEAAPRRPRAVSQTITQLAAIVQARLTPMRCFHDETEVEPDVLDDILRSISFIGPAMNERRFAAFRQRIHALAPPPIWARTLTLHAGYRNR